MGKSKITHQWDKDGQGRSILVLSKARGKLNIDEIREYLLFEARQYGHYAIIINASESTCEGSGMWGYEEQQGDVVILHEIIDNCPICSGTPPIYCPECGCTLPVEGAELEMGKKGLELLKRAGKILKSRSDSSIVIELAGEIEAHLSEVKKDE